MWKIAVALLLLAVLASAVVVVHAAATGTLLPSQDPTPEQYAYERLHERINGWLCFAAGTLWMSALAAAVVATVFWARRGEPVAFRVEGRTDGPRERPPS